MSKIVVFDIGHGSDTWPPSKGVELPGGDFFAEHTFNSEVALMARDLAEFNGFEVILSQPPFSPEVSLSERVAAINDHHAHDPVLCLLSFHANASNDSDASGHGVFHWYTSSNGKKLAEIWDTNAVEELHNGRWGSGVWKCIPETWSNYYIVRYTAMPAILLEHFFYTNFNELRVCDTEDYKKACAITAVKTICEYAGVEYIHPDDTMTCDEVLELNIQLSYMTDRAIKAESKLDKIQSILDSE